MVVLITSYFSAQLAKIAVFSWLHGRIIVLASGGKSARTHARACVVHEQIGSFTERWLRVDS